MYLNTSVIQALRFCKSPEADWAEVYAALYRANQLV